MVYRKTNIAIGSCIIVILLLVVVLHQVIAHPDVNAFLKERPIYTIFGNDTKVHNESDASDIAGYAIRFPTKLPDTYTLQLGVMHSFVPQHKYVYLFYSASAIPATMTLHDFLHGRGIKVKYDYDQDWTHDRTYGNWTGHIKGKGLHEYPDAHGITINGYNGWAGSSHTDNSEGWDMQRPSIIQYVAKGVEVTLEGGMPLNELTAIGKSIHY